MLAALTAQMPAECTWTVPTGGFYVWLTLPDGLDAKVMQPRAIHSRVAYVPGIGFYADGNGRRDMRLSYCFPEPDRIREGRTPVGRGFEEELELRDTFLSAVRLAALRSRRRDRCARSAARASGAQQRRTWPGRGMSAPDGRSSPTHSAARRRREQSRRRAGADRAPDRRGPACSWFSPAAWPTSVRCRSPPVAGWQMRCIGRRGRVDRRRRRRPGEPIDHHSAGCRVHRADGSSGEDGALRGVLDLLDVPYVGQQRGRVPYRLGQADREGRGAGGRPRHAGLGWRCRRRRSGSSARVGCSIG